MVVEHPFKLRIVEVGIINVVDIIVEVEGIIAVEGTIEVTLDGDASFSFCHYHCLTSCASCRGCDHGHQLTSLADHMGSFNLERLLAC